MNESGVIASELGIPERILADERLFWELIDFSYSHYFDGSYFGSVEGQFSIDEVPLKCAPALLQFVERTILEHYRSEGDESVARRLRSVRMMLGLDPPSIRSPRS